MSINLVNDWFIFIHFVTKHRVKHELKNKITKNNYLDDNLRLSCRKCTD